jgi:hypothetical protein
VLQGCGQGSGGAEVEMVVGDARLWMTVEETGGFQNSSDAPSVSCRSPPGRSVSAGDGARSLASP